MKIKRKISLKVCDGISTPMGIGIIKASILIPKVSYDIGEMEFILKHELMHYKRNDMIYKILLLITMSIHWFNPLIYVMCRKINRDCELSCDEAVLRKSDMSERKLYASALVNSLRLNNDNGLNQNLITGFNNKKILKGRLENMLNMKERKKGVILAVLIVAITAISLVSVNIVFKKDMNKNNNIITVKGQLLQPEQVIENYFNYYNEKNVKGVNSTHTEWLRGPSLDENLKSIKLNSIVEDTRPSEKEGYMKYGRGTINGAKAENIKIYKVNYTVKYKKNGVGPEDSGTYEKWIILVRKDKNSSWLIDDGGEG